MIINGVEIDVQGYGIMLNNDDAYTYFIKKRRENKTYLKSLGHNEGQSELLSSYVEKNTGCICAFVDKKVVGALFYNTNTIDDGVMILLFSAVEPEFKDTELESILMDNLEAISKKLKCRYIRHALSYLDQDTIEKFENFNFKSTVLHWFKPV